MCTHDPTNDIGECVDRGWSCVYVPINRLSVMIAQWENECISLSVLAHCPLCNPGSIPGRGGAFQQIFPWLITTCVHKGYFFPTPCDNIWNVFILLVINSNKSVAVCKQLLVLWSNSNTHISHIYQIYSYICIESLLIPQYSSVGQSPELHLWMAGLSPTAGWVVFSVRAFSKLFTPNC